MSQNKNNNIYAKSVDDKSDAISENSNNHDVSSTDNVETKSVTESNADNENTAADIKEVKAVAESNAVNENTATETKVVKAVAEKTAENPKITVSKDDDNNLNQSNETSVSLKASSQESKLKTVLSVSSTSILRGNSIYVYLKDNHGNPIAGKNVTLTIHNLNYTKTTNKKGAVALRFNQLWGEYNLKAHFNGDSNHSAVTSSFTLHIYKLKTNIIVVRESVARGKYLYAFIKDKNGHAIAGQKVTIRFNGKTYVKKTNNYGRACLKISSVPGEYKTKIIFPATVSYYKSSNTFTLKVHKAETKIIVQSRSVIRGRYLIAYLKNSDGKGIGSRRVIITFNNVNFYRTTNRDGRVTLRIKTKLGTFPTKITFRETGYYKGSTRSFKLYSYLLPSKIVCNSSVTRGKYFYAYLKNGINNKALSNQKVTISIGNGKYTRKTNSQGRVALKINLNAKDYPIIISYAGGVSYKSCTKYLTVKVLSNVTAKIIAKSTTGLGEYSVRLTDLKGNPLVNQAIKIVTNTYNRTSGSGKKITAKTIIIDSDHIYGQASDIKYMQNLATALRAKGYKVIVSGWGPNSHCDDVKGKYSNAVVLCLFGGADSGMFVDMSANWYQNLLKKYNNRVVLGFTVPPNIVNLATCTYLKRAHDDNYSPSSFVGLSYPGTYLNNHGMDYIYGRNVNEMANNFVNYAVKGLSIGLNNTHPNSVQTYTIKTDKNGYATLTGLASGNYTVTISYSNNALGYVADTIKTKVRII